VTPGSERVFQTIKRDGLVETFGRSAAPCSRTRAGRASGSGSARTSGPTRPTPSSARSNRNFPGRNDGSASTLSFITSPDIVTALALAGTLEFNPLTDTLTAPDGSKVRLTPPEAEELPRDGFVKGTAGAGGAGRQPGRGQDRGSREQRAAPAAPGPFVAWDGKDFIDMPILVKTKGKTTTDHISPAGPWLRYRGHLDKISDNMFLGAVNAFTGEAGKGVNPLTGEADQPFSKTARALKAAGQQWIAIGDENYGEGSSREHAAMSPRYLGAAAVHGAQLRPHPRDEPQEAGRAAADLPGPADYERFEQNDRVTISGLYTLEPASR
jgi:aconitate hydratase